MSDTSNVINLRRRPTIGFDARLRIGRLDYAGRIGERVTQDRMADELGVPRGTYRSWEAGNSKPHDVVALARRMYDVTLVDPAWLLGVADDAPSGPNNPPAVHGPGYTWSDAFPGGEVLELFPLVRELALVG